MGSMYVTLDRLEKREFVYSWAVERSKYFRLTRRGESAFQNSRTVEPHGLTGGEGFVRRKNNSLQFAPMDWRNW